MVVMIVKFLPNVKMNYTVHVVGCSSIFPPFRSGLVELPLCVRGIRLKGGGAFLRITKLHKDPSTLTPPLLVGEHQVRAASTSQEHYFNHKV